MPTIDPGDEILIDLPTPGKDIIGGYLPQDMYNFLRPLLDAYYGEGHEVLERYLQTGDINDFIDAMGDNLVVTPDGQAILIPGGGVGLYKDKNN